MYSLRGVPAIYFTHTRAHRVDPIARDRVGDECDGGGLTDVSVDKDSRCWKNKQKTPGSTRGAYTALPYRKQTL